MLTVWEERGKSAKRTPVESQQEGKKCVDMCVWSGVWGERGRGTPLRIVRHSIPRPSHSSARQQPAVAQGPRLTSREMVVLSDMLSGHVLHRNVKNRQLGKRIPLSLLFWSASAHASWREVDLSGAGSRQQVVQLEARRQVTVKNGGGPLRQFFSCFSYILFTFFEGFYRIKRIE